MPETRPTVPVGDVIRSLKLPPWLRWVMNLVRGVRIQAGPVDILLDEDGRPISRGPLDQPHRPGKGKL